MVDQRLFFRCVYRYAWGAPPRWDHVRQPYFNVLQVDVPAEKQFLLRVFQRGWGGGDPRGRLESCVPETLSHRRQVEFGVECAAGHYFETPAHRVAGPALDGVERL
ncbi:hypothetical protein ASPCADRAFT_10357 [Aspergillus carbonarius ITEM 5010]|uniref:Uncharacterized protein n=1 Tax=Aspergillus carbonarius (strain ITEM 5010) TaxID=602072 RepID=A0A1R3R842_ASPC5|nr:hypothetical protein ASPCADRAFT_10357 [Aspergillus carbonarius ITEM 5010]